jgi:N,N'-diacetyllegionaminate synthase
MSNGNARAEIIAELASSHGGDVQIAEEMIAAAADAGCDTVKIQTYGPCNPRDPQRDWLDQARLYRSAHDRLMDCAQRHGVGFLSTPSDAGSLTMLRELGLTRFKIASSESGNTWWQPRDNERWIVSFPWGKYEPDTWVSARWMTRLTAIPLYPTPLECVERAQLLDGWSDHTEGIDACLYALARGAKVLEVHLCLPGRSRVKSFDKDPSQLRQIRKFAESVATITSGVSETFRTRWSATA